MDRKPDFNRLSGTSRDLSLEVLYYCWHDGLFAHKALTIARKKAAEDDRIMARATEMAFGAIRMSLFLDRSIETAAGREIRRIESLPLYILRLAAYQLLIMKQDAPYAVVDEAVNQANILSNKGAAGFVNAVLRKISLPGFSPDIPDAKKDPSAWLSVSQSHPRWIASDWIGRFGLDAALKMCLYDNSVPPAVIRVNRMRNSREELIWKLEESGMKAEPGEVAEDSLRLAGWAGASSSAAFKEGLYSLQDESSMLVAQELRPVGGEVILDMCSAPGGKACHAAEISSDRAQVVACDSNAKRIELIKENSQRLGLRSIRTMVADAAFLHMQFEGKADACIADVPCSGLGVLSRRPDSRWRKDPSQIKGFVGIGASILDSAALCLKVGGRLIFSTCTVSPDENELQVESFLSRHPEFSLVPIKRLEGKGLSKEGSGKAQLLQGINGTDGFFIALMRKTSEGSYRAAAI